MAEYISIGKIVATFGVEGELVIKHSLGKKTTFKKGQAIFIEELKGSHIPWFIERSNARSADETNVKLEGLESKEAAKRLTQKMVWLAEADFRLFAGKTSPIALLGYTLVDDGEVLGPIEEVIEQPHQVLLRIMLSGKEALIPLHEETLDKIDHRVKQVHVTLPEGLLDVYR